MTLPNLLALRAVRRPGRQPRSGFALIISLSLMTLLLLLVLTLSILVQLELQTAKGNLYNEEAKQNALLGAYIAIGQLQKFAGPDQRITTTADLGHHGDRKDATTAQIGPDTNSIGKIFNYVCSTGEGAVADLTTPYGAPDYDSSGTLYWTAVWGHGTAPLSIYTGFDPTHGSKVSPSPILMNYLISGDEGTPLNTVETTGVVTPPDVINFTPDTGNSKHGIFRTSDPNPSVGSWTGLTNDLVIVPKAGSSSNAPAIVLVGPSSAGTNATRATNYYAGNDQGKYPGKIKEFHPALNMVVVPMVNINVPDEGATNRTVGRYAYWVGDEGVKAKYNIPDPYAGADQKGGNITTASTAAQPLRYRFGTPQRNGIERMYNMSSYTSGVNNPNTFDKTAAAMLGQVLDQSQVLLLDRNLTGLDNPADPNETLRQHFHDYTTYSYGVLADTLRGGLRYDLTSAFEPGPFADQVFNDATNGLRGKAILPPSVGAAAIITTEPFATTLGLKNRGDGSAFHGPAAPDPSNLAQPGIKWNVLQSWYRIPSQTTNQPGQPVTMQAGNATTAGVSPVFLQIRLKFGETVDNQQHQYIALEPVFVLANPYNFPITPPVGGLDIGFRINTATNWEWAVHAIARNNDRVNPHGSGVGIYLGYDNTQNTNIVDFTRGYNGAYFWAQNAESPSTPRTTGVTYGFGGGGFGVKPGYYPILKNPVSYTNFISSIPGPANSAGNTKFQSALDQIAFHIPKTAPGLGTLVFQPGEAIVFTLADETTGGKNLTDQFQPLNPRYNKMSNVLRKIVAVVGTSTSTGALFYLTGNQVVPVPMKWGAISSNAHYFMLRYTGISSGSDTLMSYGNADGKTIPAGWNLKGSPATATDYGNDTSTAWPDPQFGYISTAWPSIAATVELRYNSVAITPNTSSDFGIFPYNGTPTAAEFTSGLTTSHIALPGQNVLQTITNFDLSGAGVAGHTYVPGIGDPAGYLPPNPPQGYRRQFIGSGGSTQVPTLTNGVLPVFLTSYVMAAALPGAMDPLYFAKDAAPSADNGNTTFDPNKQVNYRTYMDFNLRAVNLSLPPTASLNTPPTQSVSTGRAVTSNGSLNAADFITSPPFGRVWNQGPAIGGGAGDDVVQASYNPLDDLSFNSKDVGPNFSSFTGTGLSQGYSSPWGNSLSTTNSGGAVPGQQFNVLFALPTRANGGTGGSIANIPDPNNSSSHPLLPDIAIMSLGQLQHADATADDVWVSVGYQRGNAIGNSYSTPFVSRSSSMNTRPNNSGLLVKRQTGLAGNTATYANVSNITGNIGIYDISYLLNCALFDRYFFSTLAQSAQVTAPANARLKYAVGIIPKSKDLGQATGGVTVTDPVTGLPMFRAFAAARYMMIDGAFNVNSTSFEAWRAVLSGMRNVAMTQKFGGSVDGSGKPTTNGTYPVVYFPRAIASNNLASATVGLTPTSMTSNEVYQPLKAGPALNPNPNAGDSLGLDAASYAGFRQLTDADIDFLAMKIVQQVHARGPFLSLAQFVNRRLTPPLLNHGTGSSYNDPLSWAGALQTAIDLNYSAPGFGTPSNSLNNFFQAAVNSAGTSPMALNISLLPGDSRSSANSNQTYPDGPNQFTSPYPVGSADLNSRLVGIPGWLTQADLLEALAPILSVRSDTFVIRTYGEVISPQANQVDLVNYIAKNPTKILSRAWCEVVVQRVPDYLATDTASINAPSTTSGTNAPNPSLGTGNPKPTLSPVNTFFGRRFKIVSVRWLNVNDI